MGVVKITYLLRMAMITSGGSFKSNNHEGTQCFIISSDSYEKPATQVDSQLFASSNAILGINHLLIVNMHNSTLTPMLYGMTVQS